MLPLISPIVDQNEKGKVNEIFKLVSYVKIFPKQ